MRDDRTVNAFDAIVDELFGDAADPREVYDIVSKANDASEMHVPGNLKTRDQQRREKRQAQIGLASNVVGLAAGGAALATAAKDPRFEEGGKVSRAIYRAGKGLPRVTPKKLQSGKGAAALAGGALGLQALNTGGDLVANRVLSRESKKKVAKALGDIVDARRKGIINTETAIQMAGDLVDSISKKQMTDTREIFDAVDAISPAIPSQKVQAANAGLQAGRKAGRKAKKLVAMAKKPPQVPPTPEEMVPMAKGLDVTWSGEISKRDDEKRQVFGFCTVTHLNGEPVIDRQGDYIPLEEIEKSAYTYVIESRKGGDMHARDGEMPLHTSDMIESFVITPEKLEKMGLAPDALPHGWWVGFKVNDDAQWEKVKKSERTGFSIHGSGKRVEKSL